jgi:Haem-binding domain
MMQKKNLLNIGLGILIVLVAIQFHRPARNLSNDDQYAIGKKYHIPDSVSAILKSACYDCHSNSTVYPWYANVQPVSLWLDDHINEGKEHLNFSEFQTYKPNRQLHAIQGVKKEVKKDDMPLSSYTLIHTDARLSAEQKNQLYAWADGIEANLRATYPADSLVWKRKKRD